MAKKFDEGISKVRFTKAEKKLMLKQAGIEVPKKPFEFRGGRPKGIRNKVNRGLDEIVKEHKIPILMKVLEEIEKGNTTLLAKMVDKLLPNLQHNVNENKETFEDWLKRQKEGEVKEQIQEKALQYIEGSNGNQ